MQWRNAAFNHLGGIDCEINHPRYGWIPFTVDPSDAGASFDAAALDAEIRADGNIAAYVPPAVDQNEVRATMQLTRRQVMIGLASEGLITAQEAIAAGNTGSAPPAIEAVFAAMPEPQQTAARITWGTFSVAYRLDPMIPVIAAAATPPLDDAALDAFFAAYAAI